VVRVLREEPLAPRWSGEEGDGKFLTSLATPRVLLVDDSQVLRTFLRRFLARAVPGGDFVEASDGNEALKVLESGDVDLVITDLVMPELDGFGVLEALRDRWPDIPVIVVSGLDDPESLEQALSRGAFDYLTKPFKAREVEIVLPLKVRNALGKHARSRQLRQLHQALQQELQKASAFVRDVLLPPVPEGWKGATWYRPAMEVGGDLYYWTERDGALWFIVADAMGHGVEAALNLALMRCLFLEGTARGGGPEDVLSFVNARLCRSSQGDDLGMYITAAVGKIRGLEGVVASAGHPSPLLLRRDGTVSPLSSGGFVLGAFPEASYPGSSPFTMGEGDALLLFTDGALPRRWNAETWRGWVEFAWREHQGRPLEELLASLWQGGAALEPPEERDDVTMALLAP